MAARAHKPWSPAEEARLLLSTTLHTRGVCIQFAASSGRSSRSVRMKLHRLLKDPANRPPSYEAAVANYRAVQQRQPDAAAPRVPTARGPLDTPDED